MTSCTCDIALEPQRLVDQRSSAAPDALFARSASGSMLSARLARACSLTHALLILAHCMSHDSAQRPPQRRLPRPSARRLLEAASVGRMRWEHSACLFPAPCSAGERASAPAARALDSPRPTNRGPFKGMPPSCTVQPVPCEAAVLAQKLRRGSAASVLPAALHGPLDVTLQEAEAFLNFGRLRLASDGREPRLS